MSGEALLRVVAAGPHVTIQDGGRPGLMRYGVPTSGAMDRGALMLANRALGNPLDGPVVEVSLGGLTLDCLEGEVGLAVAGGGFAVTLDEARHGAWEVLTIRAGQRLTIRPGPWGSWTCLAFAGHLQADRWLGSAATHALSGLGGGGLVAGATLRVTETRMPAARRFACPVWARPRRILRAVAGPQDRYFAPGTLDMLAHATFRLGGAYDRMGVRLHGSALPPVGALSIPSEPVLRGSVQVSGDGAATILLADHQTTGGYPKIATVIDADLDGFVQCRSGQAVRFRLVDPETAVALARQHGRAVAAQRQTRGQRPD